MSLRQYQLDSIRKLREGIRDGYMRQCLTIPTGGGKTRLAGGLIEGAVAKGKTVAFVCNRIELVLQAAEAFRRLGLDVGIIQGDNTSNTSAQALVCSIQTMARRGIPDADLFIIDECHTTAGSDAFKMLFASRNAVPFIGLTATPFAKGMARIVPELKGPLFDRLVVGATIPELIESGHLVDCDIYAPSQPDLSGVKIVAGDYEQDALEKAVDKPQLVGDIISHYRRITDGKKAIVFATSIAHSKHIVEQFIVGGYRAKHVDAYTLPEERRAIIDGFKAGDFEILSNCSMLAEGFDCPQTEVVILARPTRSLIRYIQMAGRALRPFHGKDKAIILDHSGTVQRLGFPTDELPMILDDGKKKPQEQKPNLPTVCKSCFAVKPKGMRKCPKCGFEPAIPTGEVETEDGELQKVERKKEKFSNDKKQEIYSALIGFAREKGLKDGWAYYKYKDIVGVHPGHNLDRSPGPMCDEVKGYMTHERIKRAKSKENAMNLMKQAIANRDGGKIKCIKCGSENVSRRDGVGPHSAGAKCGACGQHWWLRKDAA